MVAGIVADAQKGRKRKRGGVSRLRTPAKQTLPPAPKCAHPAWGRHSVLVDQAFNFSLVRVVFAGILMNAGDLTKIKAMEYFFSIPACGQLSASKIVQTLLVASDVCVVKDSHRTQRSI